MNQSHSALRLVGDVIIPKNLRVIGGALVELEGVVEKRQTAVANRLG